jgi:hypothetical protein
MAAIDTQISWLSLVMPNQIRQSPNSWRFMRTTG